MRGRAGEGLDTLIRDAENIICKMVVKIHLTGKRNRGGLKRRFMDVMRVDIQVVYVRREDAGHGRWKRIVGSGSS